MGFLVNRRMLKGWWTGCWYVILVLTHRRQDCCWLSCIIWLSMLFWVRPLGFLERRDLWEVWTCTYGENLCSSAAAYWPGYQVIRWSTYTPQARKQTEPSCSPSPSQPGALQKTIRLAQPYFTARGGTCSYRGECMMLQDLNIFISKASSRCDLCAGVWYTLRAHETAEQGWWVTRCNIIAVVSLWIPKLLHIVFTIFFFVIVATFATSLSAIYHVSDSTISIWRYSDIWDILSNRECLCR